MEVTFKNNKLKKIAENNKKCVRELGQNRAKLFMMRVGDLYVADSLEDTKELPGHYHELSGNRKGQWACDLDQPYRLIFKPHEDPIPIDNDGTYIWTEITGVEIIEIINYHEKKESKKKLKNNTIMESQNTFTPSILYHPGHTLVEKLKEMRMGIKEFAIRTSKPEKTIHAVINGESAITSDMAVAFESVTKISARFWMNKQRVYDEYIARIKREDVIAKSCNWARQFPFSSMVKYGWISANKSIEDKVNALFLFFQVSTVKAWEDYFYHQQLKVVFRISLFSTKEPFAISAWLRQGEILATKLNVSTYSEKALKEAIPVMKEIMVNCKDDYAKELQSVCSYVGIKLIYTPSLPKAPISGSTRWINDTPCIQLSGRNKRYDSFWFTFFHEIGHILLHGKKDVFLEEIEYTDKVVEKEKQADEFASKILLSAEDEKYIINSGKIRISDIKKYAAQFNTHPSIIVGRLQHNHFISFKLGNNLIPIVNLFS
jgi:Plasmid maintenance system antidote protein